MNPASMSDSPILIRRALDSDFEALTEAHIDSIRSICADLYSPELLDDWAATIGPRKYRTAVDQGAVVFVAECGNGELLGFSEVHQVRGDRYNAAVFVSGPAKRRGIGTALYQASESYALESGAQRIELNASLAAVEFYEKNGFFQVETVEIEMPSGRRLPGVQMRKQLQPEYLSGFC